ncbi:hypothetical protein IG631_24346 [Alternaria alternata]|nr:hypothetical protein IG631_24346 [Alternaria alternata]
MEHGAAPQSDQAADAARSSGTVLCNPLKSLCRRDGARDDTELFSPLGFDRLTRPQHFPKCSFTRFCNSVGDLAHRDRAQTKARSAPAGWVLDNKDIQQCVDIKCQSYTVTTYSLEKQDTFSADAKLAPELVQFFQIPTRFLTTVYRRSNGFFSSAETFSQDGELQSTCKKPAKHAASKRLLISHHRYVVPHPGQDGRSRRQLKLQLARDDLLFTMGFRSLHDSVHQCVFTFQRAAARRSRPAGDDGAASGAILAAHSSPGGGRCHAGLVRMVCTRCRA